MIQTILDRLSEEGYLEGLLKIKPQKKEPGVNLEAPANKADPPANPAGVNEGEDFFENNKPIEELASKPAASKVPRVPIAVANGEKMKTKVNKPPIEMVMSPQQDPLDDSVAKPLEPREGAEISPFEKLSNEPKISSGRSITRRKKVAGTGNKKSTQK